jgi:uncharacterized membrane-anchored protein
MLQTAKALVTGCIAFTLLAPLAGHAAGDPPAQRVDEQIGALPWQKGPAQGAVGSRAQVAIPAEMALLPEANGARFLELTGNLPQPGNTILMGRKWFAVFDFEDAGYVKDDEKLDAKALMEAMKEGQERSNEERKKRGLPQMFTDGWIVEPHYDRRHKQLEWGVKLHASTSPEPVVNYTMRLLGRHGYESVVLVTSPESLEGDIEELRAVLKGFEFNGGEKYSEFKAGDHVAEFGLGALVLGGAAAAAVKGGWWKGLLALLAAGWKLVIGAGVAVFAVFGKTFSRLFGRKPSA